jgi:hydroxymethylpyrimidine/phosphomethylpyrimidine kinase
VSCLTQQDSRNVYHIQPQPVADFCRQLDTLCADIIPDIVKLGLLGDTALIHALAPILRALNKPIVLDPILAAGGGYSLADSLVIDALNTQLLPQTTLLTPNQAEALRLSGQPDLTSAVEYFLDQACEYVLLTGTDDTLGDQVINTLYSRGTPAQAFSWSRLPHHYHGSGCTLAMACACQLALGKPMVTAVQAAQHYTWQSLQQADQPGHGQFLPWRADSLADK